MLLTTVCIGCSWHGPAARANDPLVRTAGGEDSGEEPQGRLGGFAGWSHRADMAGTKDFRLRRRLLRLLRVRTNESPEQERLQQLLAVTPIDAPTWVELARFCFNNDERKLGQQALDAAMHGDPADVTALLLKAETELQQERPSAAMETYHRVLELDFENVTALLQISRLLLEQRKPDQAAALLRSVCRCSNTPMPQAIEARRLLGILYGRSGRWDDAVRVLGSVLEHPSGVDADDWYRLAYAQYRAGRSSSARMTAAEALRRYPHDERSAALLSALESHDGLRRTASEAIGHATDFVPVAEGW